MLLLTVASEVGVAWAEHQRSPDVFLHCPVQASMSSYTTFLLFWVWDVVTWHRRAKIQKRSNIKNEAHEVAPASLCILQIRCRTPASRQHNLKSLRPSALDLQSLPQTCRSRQWSAERDKSLKTPIIGRSTFLQHAVLDGLLQLTSVCSSSSMMSSIVNSPTTLAAGSSSVTESSCRPEAYHQQITSTTLSRISLVCQNHRAKLHCVLFQRLDSIRISIRCCLSMDGLFTRLSESTICHCSNCCTVWPGKG